ncbi:MAG: hypothetical protein ABSG53_04305 [Thermoguttaceae bacterium]|jgi:hypothetical protein
MPRRIFVPFLLLLALSAPLRAAVDLVTLPTRDATQLTIYNSEDITMVREHRLLTVKEGVNRIQFSWANTLIDPTSIEFRILDQQDRVDLVDTTFPAGRNDALQWNIKSQIAGKIPVEIRYFTSGITWAADYVGIANEDETKLNVTGYVRVSNNSGGQYDNAQTRLVVGKINLVEKIADLATRPAPSRNNPVTMESINGLDTLVLRGDRKDVAKAMKEIEEVEKDARSAGRPKQVIKQGLSEYFLFTIEGRETIKDKEPKRLVALKVAEVPLESIYKLSDRTGDQQFTKFYRFKNVKLLDAYGKEKKLSSMENLGLSPLPNGTVRLFSEYKSRDLAYVGGTETKYVPIGDRVEVNVGPDKDITIQRHVKDQKIGNVVVRQYKRRLDNEFVLYYDLVDYDETFFYEEELVSGKSAKIEVERQSDANVVLWGEREEPKGWTSNEAGAYVDLHKIAGRVERVDQQHVKYLMDLKPGNKQRVEYSVTYKRRKVGPEMNTEKKREPL